MVFVVFSPTQIQRNVYHVIEFLRDIARQTGLQSILNFLGIASLLTCLLLIQWQELTVFSLYHLEKKDIEMTFCSHEHAAGERCGAVRYVQEISSRNISKIGIHAQSIVLTASLDYDILPDIVGYAVHFPHYFSTDIPLDGFSPPLVRPPIV